MHTWFLKVLRNHTWFLKAIWSTHKFQRPFKTHTIFLLACVIDVLFVSKHTAWVLLGYDIWERREVLAGNQRNDFIKRECHWIRKQWSVTVIILYFRFPEWVCFLALINSVSCLVVFVFVCFCLFLFVFVCLFVCFSTLLLLLRNLVVY